MSGNTHKSSSNEVIAGLLLIACAILALIASNLPIVNYYYDTFLDTHLAVSIGQLGLDKPLLLWINDGLMAIFFLAIGLELKRELVTGELQDFNKVALPVAGAIGGMIVPALIFYLITRHDSTLVIGWAIPMATDIAFALGILALFGKRVPITIKIFLMTLAIIDDLGAIIVIGIFHTAQLSWISFALAVVCIIILLLLNRFYVDKLSPYLLVGLVMWVCVLNSGFHATIAGVILALTIPLNHKNGQPMLAELENDLLPLVAFFILPLFAFANAGIPFNNMNLGSFIHPLFLAIVVGLIVGKILGVFCFTLLSQKILGVKLSFSKIQLLGVSLLCGIGFTMSLFIASLSFGTDDTLLNLSRLGILTGSFVAIILGYTLLNYSLPPKEDVSE